MKTVNNSVQMIFEGDTLMMVMTKSVEQRKAEALRKLGQREQAPASPAPESTENKPQRRVFKVRA